MAENAEEVKVEETTKTKTKAKYIKVKLIKNVKYGDTSFKLGETIGINQDDYEEFKDAGVILVQEEVAQGE